MQFYFPLSIKHWKIPWNKTTSEKTNIQEYGVSVKNIILFPMGETYTHSGARTMRLPSFPVKPEIEINLVWDGGDLDPPTGPMY